MRETRRCSRPGFLEGLSLSVFPTGSSLSVPYFTVLLLSDNFSPHLPSHASIARCIFAEADWTDSSKGTLALNAKIRVSKQISFLMNVTYLTVLPRCVVRSGI